MGCGQEIKKNYNCEFLRLIKNDDFTYSLDFSCEEIKIWQEGNHSMLIIGVNDTLVGKKFSFVTLAEEEVIRITTRITDDSSEYKKALLHLEKGDYVKISEPAGDFRLRREDRPVLLLSNGVGIAGVRSLVKQYVNNQSQIPEMLLLNVDGRSDIYKKEFDGFHANVTQFKPYYLSHRASYYSMLYHELSMIVKRHELSPIFYITGSDEFVEDTIMYLRDLDFDEEAFLIGGKQTDSCCRS